MYIGELRKQNADSRNNFKIGPEASMPKEIIYAFGYLKKAAALANMNLAFKQRENVT
jgi:fumarate hydratase class II